MIVLIAEIVVAICLAGMIVLVARRLSREGGLRVPETKIAEPPPVATSITVPPQQPAALTKRLEGFGGAIKKVLQQIQPALKRILTLAQTRLGPAVVKYFNTVKAATSHLLANLKPKFQNFTKSAGTFLSKTATFTQQVTQRVFKALGQKIQKLRDTIEHMQMRQKEHAARMKEKKEFLGDLMDKVVRPKKAEGENQAVNSTSPLGQSPEDVPSAPVELAEPEILVADLAASQQPESVKIEETQEIGELVESVDLAEVPEEIEEAEELEVPKSTRTKVAWQFFERFKNKGPAPLEEVLPKVEVIEPAEPDERTLAILREQEQIILHQITKTPQDIALYKRLGFVYVELGEKNDARLCFAQAVKLGSQDPLVKRELQILNQDLGGVE